MLFPAPVGPKILARDVMSIGISPDEEQQIYTMILSGLLLLDFEGMMKQSTVYEVD